MGVMVCVRAYCVYCLVCAIRMSNVAQSLIQYHDRKGPPPMLTMRPGLPTYSPVHSPTHSYPPSPRANTGRTRLASTAPREGSSSPWEPDKNQIAATAL